MTAKDQQQPEQAGEEQARGPHPREIVARLAEAYPDTFFTDGRKVRPLAIGLIRPLLAEREEKLPDLSARQLRKAIRFYTQAAAYHRAVLDGRERVDLEGNVAGQVTEKEQAYSKERLDAIPARKKGAGKRPNRRQGDGEERPRRRRRAQSGPGRGRPGNGEGRKRREPEKTRKPTAPEGSMDDKLAALQKKFNG